jgi:FG-GAP-like repeat/ASPIC and UnbV
MLVSSTWTAAAQQQGVAWDRAREAITKYRTMLDSSGLVEVGANMAPGVRRDDLQALCTGRRQAIERARDFARSGLRTLVPGDDPITAERTGAFERYLGSVASFTGENDLAAKHFLTGRDALLRMLPDAPSLKRPYLALLLALGTANMRQGETANCLVTPSADRCVFPLRPGGVHRHPEAAEHAVERFTEYLTYEPEDLGVRWLLNLAYMLLGKYPESVPPQYLLKPDLFESEAPMPRFFDVARPAKLGRMDVAGGTIAEDFDGDGLVDLFLTSVDYCSPVVLYRNRGDGTFEDRTEAAGLLSQLGGINTIPTDYNNDGWIDIFIMRGGWEAAMRNSLLRNNGDGTFTDVTREAGLLDGGRATHSVAWLDYDNDGWVDVFVAHEMTPAQLFRNKGDGTFEDVSARAGVGITAFTKGVVAGDYDGNGYPDVYLSNMFGDNALFRNNGDGTFTEVGKALGVEKPFASFPTWFFDYDNDGRLDIFVDGYPNSVEEFVKYYLGQPAAAETMMLYRNAGDGRFEDVTRKTRLDRVVPGMGSNFGDLDNDGFLDMYIGTGTPSFGALMPNVMLKNDAGKRFLDVTADTGTGNLQKGHGIAFVDIDSDGDQDVFLNSGGAVPGDRYDESLYENPGTPGRHWIKVKLVGVKSSRAAIGANITVSLPQPELGSRIRYREVTTGGMFGANSFTQHIGIGAATAIESLTINWPTSKTRQVFRKVPIDSLIEIRELADDFTVRSEKRFRLAGPSQDQPPERQ